MSSNPVQKCFFKGKEASFSLHQLLLIFLLRPAALSFKTSPFWLMAIVFVAPAAVAFIIVISVSWFVAQQKEFTFGQAQAQALFLNFFYIFFLLLSGRRVEMKE